MALQKDLKEFIESLNSNGVEYLIVGAYAVAFHGRPRLTGDIDFFVSHTRENAQRIAKAVADFSSGCITFDVNQLQQPDQMIRIGNEPNRVDILTSVSGVEFDDAWSTRIAAPLDGVSTFFISYDNLIKNKLSTGRLKDAADADELKRPSS